MISEFSLRKPLRRTQRLSPRSVLVYGFPSRAAFTCLFPRSLADENINVVRAESQEVGVFYAPASHKAMLSLRGRREDGSVPSLSMGLRSTHPCATESLLQAVQPGRETHVWTCPGSPPVSSVPVSLTGCDWAGLHLRHLQPRAARVTMVPTRPPALTFLCPFRQRLIFASGACQGHWRGVSVL